MSEDRRKYAESWEPPLACFIALAAVIWVGWAGLSRITALEKQLGLKMEDGKYVQVEKAEEQK